ncbi:TPM domain-containing protein [Hyalangium rubrum]|uniref:TPM domain-containing protein n=1 Tax=Hyalangium rubrum TaxID=3103134 RepID=A0ABU5H266_9BACT|nr:TPM domain-containing protein [Hyalangium sp. s54d21]MDY7227543.1 TPM domain-containing protein [Hyalangium sp. s54d21]
MPRLLLSLLLLVSPAALALNVDFVPDPRPGHQVLDLTGTLSESDIARIDAVSHGNGELVVVVLDNLDGQDPRDFTTRLFNHLRVDLGSRNRGVLFLVALSDRAAEIVVGDGYPGSVTSRTDAIMSNTIIPGFSRGDARGAIVSGAEELSRRVLSGSAVSSPSSSYQNSYVAGSATSSSGDAFPWGLGGAGALGLTGLAGRAWLRRRPRKCAGCATQMVKLDERADNAHLTAAERLEESLGSVDYDVWLCEGCGHTEKLRYGAIFTQFSKCGSCRAKTLKTTSRTLVSATEHSSGTAEVTERCAHCNYENKYTRSIPRKSSSNRSSSSSSRSSFGSSSRSSGGSSSGRGSSGRW